MQQLATLTNQSKQPVEIILDHPAFLNPESGWSRTTEKFAATDANGVRSTTEVRRSYPGVLRLQPGETSAVLHPAVVNCLQVQQLIAKKILAVAYTKGSAS